MDVANPPDHTGRDELLDAARLGMKRSTLHGKMQKLGISRPK